jgi:hypothetical protein
MLWSSVKFAPLSSLENRDWEKYAESLAFDATVGFLGVLYSVLFGILSLCGIALDKNTLSALFRGFVKEPFFAQIVGYLFIAGSMIFIGISSYILFWKYYRWICNKKRQEIINEQIKRKEEIEIIKKRLHGSICTCDRLLNNLRKEILRENEKKTMRREDLLEQALRIKEAFTDSLLLKANIEDYPELITCLKIVGIADEHYREEVINSLSTPAHTMNHTVMLINKSAFGAECTDRLLKAVI